MIMENSQLKIRTSINNFLYELKSEQLPIRRLTHLEAVKSELPILRELGSEYTQPLKAVYFKAISDYVSIYHPGSDNQNVSTEFIELLFENYYTLNPIDVFAYINYIKLNKPKVSGHKITPTEMIESLQAYIEQRQEAHEQILHNRKFESINQPIAQNVSDKLQEFIDKQEEKKKLKIEKINNSVDERRQMNEEHMKKYKSIRDRLLDKVITEEEGVIEWNNFLNQY